MEEKLTYNEPTLNEIQIQKQNILLELDIGYQELSEDQSKRLETIINNYKEIWTSKPKELKIKFNQK